MKKIKLNRKKGKKEFVVQPEPTYRAKVIKIGDKAFIKSFKKYIGKTALVVIESGKPTKPNPDMISKDVFDMADVMEHAGKNWPSN
jgi:putative transposon-encoded protein